MNDKITVRKIARTVPVKIMHTDIEEDGDESCVLMQQMNARTPQGIVAVDLYWYRDYPESDATRFEMILNGERYSANVRQCLTSRQVGQYARAFALRCQSLAEALPAPKNMTSPSDAAAFIARAAGVSHTLGEDIMFEPESLAQYYRTAAKRIHPDRGGKHDAFVRLQQAKAILDEFHAVL